MYLIFPEKKIIKIQKYQNIRIKKKLLINYNVYLFKFNVDFSRCFTYKTIKKKNKPY